MSLFLLKKTFHTSHPFAFLCSFSSSSIKFMKRRDGEGRTACGIQDAGMLLVSTVRNELFCPVPYSY